MPERKRRQYPRLYVDAGGGFAVSAGIHQRVLVTLGPGVNPTFISGRMACMPKTALSGWVICRMAMSLLFWRIGRAASGWDSEARSYTQYTLTLSRVTSTRSMKTCKTGGTSKVGRKHCGALGAYRLTGLADMTLQCYYDRTHSWSIPEARQRPAPAGSPDG